MSFHAGNVSVVGRRLLDSAALLDPLLTSMPSAAVVVDSERRIVLVSDAFAARAGIARESLIGQRAGGILSSPTKGNRSCDTCTQRTGFCEVADRVFAARKPLTTRTQLSNCAGGAASVGVRATPFEFEGRPHALMILDEEADVSPAQVCHPQSGTYGIIGRHPKVAELFETIDRAARMKLPVLIQGESGTGKEMVAIALHEQSRRSGPLVTVNSGALPEGVLESELFGHVRGAFTGAVRDKRGRFEMAHRGTLFLDEIGEISPAMQVKLLRALQEGTFERVGGEQTVKVDVRVICATNRDLEADVASGRFRADLFYRISVVPITIPPLRARASDIPLLARHFLERASAMAEIPAPEIADETMSVLMHYRWPGNVRELESAMHFAILNATDGVVLAEHLPPRVCADAMAHLSHRTLTPLQVNAALRATHGNKLRAAQLLGVGRATLYRFLGQGDDTIVSARALSHDRA